MRPVLGCRHAASTIAGLIAATTLGASAASYSVNFLGNTTANVTAAAGVLGNTGWNNVGPSFTGSIVSNDGGSSATLAVTGPSAGGGWNSGLAADAGNGGLMRGYMDVTNNGGATITITGIADGAYDVYMYTFGDDPRPQNAGDWLPNYTVAGTTYYTGVLGNNSSTSYTSEGTPTPIGFSSFIQASPLSVNTNAVVPLATYGNYLKVSGVTVTGGQLVLGAGLDTTNPAWRSALNGFELVSVPEPSGAMLTMLGGLFGFGFLRRRKQS